MEVDGPSDSEEEILVYAEFNEGVDVDQYRSIHVLGIDCKKPIIQADDSFFTGKFVNALGTYMFFEEDPTPLMADPLFDKLPEKNLKYLCKTSKLLEMEHAYVMPVATNADQNAKTELEESDYSNIKPVKFTSLNDALQNFKTALAPLIVNSEDSQTDKDSETVPGSEITTLGTDLPDEAVDT